MLENYLHLIRPGIDTHQELVVYMRQDCHVCRSEGFTAHSRVRIQVGERSAVATLNIVKGDFLPHNQAALSEAAWRKLKPEEGEKAYFKHAPAVDSMSAVRGKLYGKPLTTAAAKSVIEDINAGHYSDIQLAAFVAACSGNRLTLDETVAITGAMIDAGQRFKWNSERVLDKHCVGGLPGNRTTPIVTAIIAANGLVMPKTSSRAITSPAGTADTMEVLTDVQLSYDRMAEVVKQTGGCLAWGGSVSLSPADDVIIRVERALDLDSEGQLVASVISKKVAAGSTHVLIDIPTGPTAKVRSPEFAARLSELLIGTGAAFGLKVKTIISDGSQPVGMGIGPALEARDVLKVLQCQTDSPQDLRSRSLAIAAALLEMSAGNGQRTGTGQSAGNEWLTLATDTLDSGRAYQKFQEICLAQGRFSEPELAAHRRTVKATRGGIVSSVNNRILARLASLAGAPNAKAAGLDLHVRLGDCVTLGDPLLTVYAEAPGELEYALDFLMSHPDGVHIGEEAV
ncbi:thymidine phosphorylase [Oleiphilus messinensis]|uniref:Putative thymidine phosphorylase n=1 Tax=Oleiphilus messinensis TaxID=141451 RepID=A0A1Y0ICW4_9GAMM|nr:thymidine phosphorylase family protein [Oleiphilus messinensis]ARU58378.1 thymidine phosphorylase [Oleiphilus messinensis]